MEHFLLQKIDAQSGAYILPQDTRLNCYFWFWAQFVTFLYFSAYLTSI